MVVLKARPKCKPEDEDAGKEKYFLISSVAVLKYDLKIPR